jgi:outer membrane receptor protein involved in Fe transport
MRISIIVFAVGGLACGLASFNASAQGVGNADAVKQTDSGAADSIPEIVVTAQKRSERLQDVPMSITAATGAELANRGVTEPADLENVVTGFAYQRSSYGVPVYSIRGIGFLDTALAVSPTVSVYVDQIPLPFSPMAEGAVLDLARVEALKGPQGTLFGQNSTGGAINFIAAKPTKEFKTGFDLSAGRFADFEGEGFVSGPLSETVTARLAIHSEQSGDWQRDYTRSAYLGARHFDSGRLLVDFDPTDDIHWELNVNGWKDTSDTQAAQFLLYAPSVPHGLPEQAAALPLQPTAPADPRAADWDPGQALRNNNHMGQIALRGDFNLPGVTLTSISAYSNYKQNSVSDPDGSNFQDFLIDKIGGINALSQELRLSGNFDDHNVIWTAGGNIEHDSTLDHEVLLPPYGGSNGSVGPFRFNTFVNSNDEKIDTYAGFGALDFKFSPTLTAQASARYTKQNRNFAGCVSDIGGSLADAFNLLHSLIGVSGTIPEGGCVTYDTNTNAVVQGLVHKSLDQSNVSWRGGLNWEPTGDLLVYGNVTKGYKAGSFPTIAAIQSAEYTPVTQESVLAYEAGFKLAALNRKLEISGAAFHYDYRDKQILGFYESPIFGSLPALVNVPKSKVDGAEVDLTAQPMRTIRLSVGATYIASKVTSDFTTANPFGDQLDIKGESFPNAPKWEINGDAEYTLPLSDAFNAFVGASGRYRTASYAAFGATPLFLIDAYGTLDVRAGIETQDAKWRGELWGRNVTNTYYWNNVSHLVDTVARTAGMPATFGIKVSYRY